MNQLDLIVTDENAIVKTARKQASKKASVKTEKTVRAEKATKTVKAKTSDNATDAKSIKRKAQSTHKRLINVLNKRLEIAESATGKNCATLRNDIKMFTVTLVQQALENEIDLDKFIELLKITDKSDEKHIAVKVITKYRQLFECIMRNNFEKLDGYTQAILFNLQRLEKLNAEEVYASLSSNLPQPTSSRKIVREKVTAVGTVSTQASSSRMLLLSLDICIVQKNKCDDVIRFTSSKLAKKLENLAKNSQKWLELEKANKR